MWSGFPPAYWDLYFRTNTPPTWASACPMGSKGNLRDTSCALLSKSWWKGGEKMVKRWWSVLPWYFPSRWRHHLWQEGELFWHNHVHHSWAPNPIWHVTSWGKDPLKNVMFFNVFVGSPNPQKYFLLLVSNSSKKCVIVFCHVLPWNDDIQ